MVVGVVWIHQGGDAGDVWRDLLQYSKQFCAQTWLHHGKTSQVAAGTGEALNETVAHGITAADEYDGNCTGRSLRRLGRRIAICRGPTSIDLGQCRGRRGLKQVLVTRESVGM